MDLHIGTFHHPDNKPNMLFWDVFRNDGARHFTGRPGETA
jgi:hypothetical protein